MKMMKTDEKIQNQNHIQGIYNQIKSTQDGLFEMKMMKTGEKYKLIKIMFGKKSAIQINTYLAWNEKPSFHQIVADLQKSIPIPCKENDLSSMKKFQKN